MRRQRAITASVAAVAAVVLVAGVVALRPKANKVEVAATTTTLQNDVAPTSIASPPTTTVPPTPGRPNILVAATGDNKIVRLDPQTGKQLKVLVDLNGRLTPGPASGDIQVTACCVAFDSANGLVYYGWGRTISSVPVDGGAESVVIEDAGGFTISPDGMSMYYRPFPQGLFKAHLRDLKSNSDTLLINTPDCVARTTGACQLANAFWSLDSNYVYVNAITYANNAASESATIRKFDIHQPDQSPDRGAATPFTNQVNYDPQNRFGIIRFLDENRVLAYSSNAGSSILQLTIPPHPSQSLDIVDAKSGRKLSTLVPLATDRGYQSIGSDASGKYVLYVSETGGGAGDLRVSDNGSSRTVVLASNILAASW
jgi:hypothetical protein